MKEFDFSREYGLVLEGGGAKGAYQIGVWKALREHGVKIKGVSGVSVGALNGALICMDDYEKAEEVWKNISYSKVMNVNNEMMESLMGGKFKEIDLAELTRRSARILMERGIDVEPLKNWIGTLVEEEKIRKSPIEFILGTFSLSRFKQLEVNAKEVEPGLLKDFLLASSYFPGFKSQKLHGEKFIDGGLVDNVPTDMLIKRGYQDLIIIRIFGMGLERRTKIPEHVRIIEIFPREDLGNMFEFDSKRSMKNIEIGYYDGLRCLRCLAGRDYYIEDGCGELHSLSKLLHIPRKLQTELLEYYRVDPGKDELFARSLVEGVYPLIAGELKLEKDWTYGELYLSLLETAAQCLSVPRYAIYTKERLLAHIAAEYERREEGGAGLSDFDRIILKIILTSDEKNDSV